MSVCLPSSIPFTPIDLSLIYFYPFLFNVEFLVSPFHFFVSPAALFLVSPYVSVCGCCMVWRAKEVICAVFVLFFLFGFESCSEGAIWGAAVFGEIVAKTVEACACRQWAGVWCSSLSCGDWDLSVSLLFRHLLLEGYCVSFDGNLVGQSLLGIKMGMELDDGMFVRLSRVLGKL